MSYPAPAGLVVSASTGRTILDSMNGGEQFTNSRWIDWATLQSKINITEYGKALTKKEIIKLCDTARTHMYWWLKVPDGAILFARPYAPERSGNRLLYPGETSRSVLHYGNEKKSGDAGGTLV